MVRPCRDDGRGQLVSSVVPYYVITARVQFSSRLFFSKIVMYCTVQYFTHIHPYLDFT